jgi:ribosomal protein S18 acetylase RimI-like enzyme
MIRRMTLSDLERAVAIQQEAFAGTTLGFTRLQLEVELARATAVLLCACAEPNGQLAQSEAKVQGVLIAWQIAGDFELLNMAVATEARGCGLGRALVSALIELAQEGADGACIFLEVRTDNAPALALYRSAGFEASRVRKGYYQDGCDALEMVLRHPTRGPFTA